MTEEQWKMLWWDLVDKVGKEPCPNVLGMDLIREELIENANVLNSFPLTVLGKEDFLQNMLHRVMGWDIDRRVPIIILAPNTQLELKEEIYGLFSKRAAKEARSFFHYPTAQPVNPPSFTFDNFFRIRRNESLYAALDPKGSPASKKLLSLFENEIKTRFDATRLSLSRNEFPAIYILEPGLFEPSYQISKYVAGLKDHAAFRLFSKDFSIFDTKESSFIYGPEIYDDEICEKLRRHCYQFIDQKRKCAKRHCGLCDPESPEALAGALANARISMKATAFAHFKTKYGLGYECFWFYPAHKNLGKEACSSRSHEADDDSEKNNPAVAANANTPVDDPVKKVINDLKPKEPAQP